MQAEETNYKYSIGTQIPLPPYLKSFRLCINGLNWNQIREKIELLDDPSTIEALELTFSNFKLSLYVQEGKRMIERIMSEINNFLLFLPHLKFFRIIILYSLRSYLKVFLKAIEKLEHLHAFEIYYNKSIIDKQRITDITILQQQKKKDNQIKYVLISNVQAPIKLKQQESTESYRNFISVGKESRSALKNDDLAKCKNIEQWRCFYLFIVIHLSEQKRPPLPTICHIDFPQLRWLEIRGLSIDTIESITTIKAPLLEVIEIDGNQVHSLRPFKKTNSREIACLLIGQLINISSNNVQEAECLSEVNWPHFSKFQFDEFHSKTVFVQSLHFLAKLNTSNKTMSFSCSCAERIHEQSAEQKIRNRNIKKLY